MKIGKKPVR